MRYRVAVLMLLMRLVVLPAMYLPAAPAPERPYAILDIGPPPKGKTAEEHCKEQIGYLTAPRGILFEVWCDPEVQKLRLYESVRSLTGKDFEPWLEKTIRVTPEKGGRRLHFSSRAGNRAEQAVIINTLLRIYIRDYVSRPMKGMERILRRCEESASRDAKLIREEPDPLIRKRFQQQHEWTKARNANFLDEIPRLKQVAVIKWAK